MRLEGQLKIMRQRRLMASLTPLIICSIGILVCGLALRQSMIEARRGVGWPSIAVAVSMTLVIVVCGFYIAAVFARLRYRPRIVLYFQRSIGARDQALIAFRRGGAIFHELTWLDQLADRHGVMKLSSFGFADDYLSQTPRWHNSLEGVKTVTTLLRAISEMKANDRTLLTEITEDLRAMHEVLARASDASFCLIIRLGHDRMISLAEMNRRQGSFL